MIDQNTEKKRKKKPEFNKNKIESITDDVVDELERRVTSKNRFLIIMRSYSIELFSAVLIGLLIAISASMFPKYFYFNDAEEQVMLPTEHSISGTSHSINRDFYVRAMLSNVLAELSVTKCILRNI